MDRVLRVGRSSDSKGEGMTSLEIAEIFPVAFGVVGLIVVVAVALAMKWR